MSALDEILTWSASAPAWLRDALRRIVTSAELTETDIAELAELCKVPHGLNGGQTKAPEPLSAEHLPTPSDVGDVALLTLTHVADVNALAPGETLTFARYGLTIVYGDNGAGKSGYARILKRACRARGSGDPVLVNALSDRPAGTPTAKIKVAVGDTEVEHVWKDGTPGAPELGAVGIFDTAAAHVYVGDKTEVKFRPFGLDILDKLAEVTDKVRKRIESERDDIASQTIDLPVLPANTEAGRLLATLTALTPPDDVKRIATLSEAEERELARLRESLAAAKFEDPLKRANDLDVKVRRLRRLIEALRALAEQMNTAAVEDLVRLRREAAETANTARELARSFKDVTRLPGLEDPAWRRLWDAAQEFSERAAYPDKSFPHVGHGAVCVLCQQDLTAEGSERLTRFADLVRADAQETARKKSAAVQEREERLSELVPAQFQREARDDLAARDAQLSGQVEAFVSGAGNCRDGLLTRNEDPTPLAATPPIDGLTALAKNIETLSAELRKTADPVERKGIEKRLEELEARHKLAEHLPAVLGEITRKARLNAYANCLKDTETRAVTRLSSDLTKRYVTDVLTSAFQDELTKLGFDTLELELRPVGGAKGALYHQVQLKHATKARLPRVVSEGEARCIALAAFLAEFRSGGHRSGIVFDDPVSSLGHLWRDRVAGRLVEEAKVRPVAVFTHEVVFLYALVQAAKAAGVPYVAQSVWRKPATAGHVDPELPWEAMPTTSRIGWLKNEWQRVEKLYRTEGRRVYDPLARQLYGKLRQGWERGIEEVLLCGVVERFRRSIETQRLKFVHDIQESDIETVKAGMSKSSRWEGGHDHAPAENDPVPAPDELKRDIDDLENWVKSVNKRRK